MNVARTAARKSGTMRSRSIWGVVLLTGAALAATSFCILDEAYWAARREHQLLFVGTPLDSLAAGLLVVAVPVGTAGLLLLLPILIGRMRRRPVRRLAGWATAVGAAAAAPCLGVVFAFAVLGATGIGDTVRLEAADGRSVLVTQDGFDGDVVDIYTEYGSFRYKWARSAPELSGWPRVTDQACRLDAGEPGLRLVCGDKTMGIDVQEPAR